MPKSTSFTPPRRDTRTFDGEMSQDFAQNENCDLTRHSLAPMCAFAKHRQDVETVDELHGDVQAVFAHAQLVGLRDFWMRQLGGDLRFRNEHFFEMVIDCEMRQDALDHHGLFEAVRAGGPGQEQLCHSAQCQAFGQFIPTELYRKTAPHPETQ
jgi:hypothetical protein